ncbi:hypothetical protein GCM10007972_13240 [Iodidimonas muriae]|uniref:Uncharacterized protein n=1 Tax=Iodidimonas muriae TaxID=261467 RepID=A0ABQ2LCH0_9PROT|nr:hypothetical protein [Iodidimonas muriae]GER06668.1 hypothetical protein JCM17843_09780 [Kordiimonadales bacterium JCM 17843]GGO10431.1 hypothetical protein GCM10007972_13240 [Iodidimonas muriae]
MKVLWIIDRLDGTKAKITTRESTEPVSGDGTIVDGIPVAIGSKVTTPLSGEFDKHDIVIAAKEQKN